jgi:hypothetical protein
MTFYLSPIWLSKNKALSLKTLEFDLNIAYQGSGLVSGMGPVIALRSLLFTTCQLTRFQISVYTSFYAAMLEVLTTL